MVFSVTTGVFTSKKSDLLCDVSLVRQKSLQKSWSIHWVHITETWRKKVEKIQEARGLHMCSHYRVELPPGLQIGRNGVPAPLMHLHCHRP